MSTVLFFIMVGVLAVYGLCEGIVRLVARMWIPRDMKAVTLVQCEDSRTVTPFIEDLWREKVGHPVFFLTTAELREKTERNSLSNAEEILLFLSK